MEQVCAAGRQGGMPRKVLKRKKMEKKNTKKTFGIKKSYKLKSIGRRDRKTCF